MMISAETVTQTWQRMAMTPVSEVSGLVEQMKDEQPVVMAYLLASEELPFNRNEFELVFYIGMVVWQMMRQSPRPLRKVTRNKLRQAEKANLHLLQRFDPDNGAEPVELAELLSPEYAEPEVLRYILEAIEEEPQPGETPIRDEYRGLAFVYLKAALDAFIASLTPQRR